MQSSNSAPSGSWPVTAEAVEGQVLAKLANVADGVEVEPERSLGEVESKQAAVKVAAAVIRQRPVRAPCAAKARADGGMGESFDTVANQ